MSRDWRLYLADMRSAAAKICRFTSEMTRQEFEADERTRDAVLRNLEILGEAAKRIPEDIRLHHCDIDWRRISGLRDVVAHAYFGIDDSILWDIVANKTPVLARQLETPLWGED